tara:strand:- start:17418 stop:18311 length:894 start_codon:yes stop_codon:yes gene_type:complete
VSKSLVIGANGLVGQNFMDILSASGREVVGTCFSRSHEQFKKLDILNKAEISQLFEEVSPDEVYFCANFPGGVNRCEDEREQATRFHLDSVKNIVSECKKLNSKLIFISTDYVFADSKEPVEEDHERNPLNVYGDLKAKAEDYIQENLTRFLSIRTTNIYGLDLKTKTPNYFMQIFSKLKNNEKVKTSSQMYGTPTPAKGLAQSILLLVDKDVSGIFHIVGPEYVNRYEWALEIAKEFGFDQKLIENVPANTGGCKRPLNLRLSTSKIKNTVPFNILGLKEELNRIHDDFNRITLEN